MSDDDPWTDDDDLDTGSHPGPPGLDFFDDQVGVEDGGGQQPAVYFTVSNPANTVSVTAVLGGRVQRIELSPSVASMTESEVSDEIQVLSNLASQKALAAQHGVVAALLQDMGHDPAMVCEFLAREIGLPSPDQVAALTGSVMKERYAEQER